MRCQGARRDVGDEASPWLPGTNSQSTPAPAHGGRGRGAHRGATGPAELLTRKPPTSFSFIIEESVLLRDTGGEDVTRELHDHLIRCGELWTVEIQIMPPHQPYHAGADGPESGCGPGTAEAGGLCRTDSAGRSHAVVRGRLGNVGAVAGPLR